MKFVEFLPYISVIIVIANFWYARKTETKTDEQKLTEISVKLDYLTSTIFKMETSLNATNSSLNTVEKKSIEIYASCKSAHKRIDELLDDIEGIKKNCKTCKIGV